MAKRKFTKAGDFKGDVTFKLGEATKYSQPLKKKTAESSNASTTAVHDKYSKDKNRVEVKTRPSAGPTSTGVPTKKPGYMNVDIPKPSTPKVNSPTPAKKPGYMNVDIPKTERGGKGPSVSTTSPVAPKYNSRTSVRPASGKSSGPSVTRTDTSRAQEPKRVSVSGPTGSYMETNDPTRGKRSSSVRPTVKRTGGSLNSSQRTPPGHKENAAVDNYFSKIGTRNYPSVSRTSPAGLRGGRVNTSVPKVNSTSSTASNYISGTRVSTPPSSGMKKESNVTDTKRRQQRFFNQRDRKKR